MNTTYAYEVSHDLGNGTTRIQIQTPQSGILENRDVPTYLIELLDIAFRAGVEHGAAELRRELQILLRIQPTREP